MIEIDAPGYVPFEPRTTEQRALRAELRNKLRQLRAGPGEILHATFSGRLRSGTDVENALLYNLGGAGVFAGSMRNGVSFELDPEPHPAGVRYTYTLAPEAQGFRHWHAARSLATLDVELDGPPTLATLWWALRSSPAATRLAGTRGPDEPYAVTLDVSGPAMRLAPPLIKVILDGVVCSLQSQTDPVDATLASLIAVQVDAPAEGIREALGDTRPSALGVRRRLVCTRSTGVQWLPDDHLCMAAKMLLRPNDRWHITGDVAAVTPSASQQHAHE